MTTARGEALAARNAVKCRAALRCRRRPEPPMLRIARNLYDYRELLLVLTWKNITLRYKQSYLGVAWAVLRPLMLVAIFMVVRSFVGIDSGAVPYALLTYCAMVPWIYFQDAASDSVGSVVNHASLVKKIYFPREVFPLAGLLTKTLELGIGLAILALMMAWYRWVPGWHALWVLPLLLYTMLTALTIGLAGAALNVYARDMSQGVPLLLSMLMYLSPVMYPIDLVRKALLDNQAAGAWSDAVYGLFILNPMAGVIDGMQRALLRGQHPDLATLWPGMVLVAVLLPLSYLFFKRAEAYFADVI
jgi:lipopolysaccharide transport system permease protein